MIFRAIEPVGEDLNGVVYEFGRMQIEYRWT